MMFKVYTISRQNLAVTLAGLMGALVLAPRPSHAAAPLTPGTYQAFDLYGDPQPVDEAMPEIRAVREFQAHARKGGELRLALTEPVQIIYPVWVRQGDQLRNFRSRGLLFESLMQSDPFGEDRTLVPRLARAITVQEDGRTVVIQLRPGVRFSDGTLMSTRDIIESWHFHKNIAGGKIRESYFQNTYGTLDFRVVSDLTLEIVFRDIPSDRVRSAIYEFLSLNIVKSNPGPTNLNGVQYPYLGTGPYRVTYADLDRVQLVRRRDYWNANAPFFNFDSVKFLLIREGNVRREAVSRDDKTLNIYDGTSIPADQALLDTRLKEFDLRKTELDYGFPQGRTNTNNYLMMNTTRSHLNRLAFRQAMALAWDLEYPNRVFLAGNARSMDVPGELSRFAPHGPPSAPVTDLMRGLPNFADALNAFESVGIKALLRAQPRRERLRQAMSLLKADGYILQGTQLIKDGQPVRLFLPMVNDHGIQLASVFAANLKRLGIELDYRSMPDTASWVKVLHSNSYDFSFLYIPWEQDYSALDAEMVKYKYGSENATAIKTGSRTNISNLRLPVLDRLIEQLYITDPKSQSYRDVNEAIARILNVEVAFLPQSQMNVTYVYHQNDICLAPKFHAYLMTGYACPKTAGCGQECR